MNIVRKGGYMAEPKELHDFCLRAELVEINHNAELAITVVRPMIELVTMITQDESDTVFLSVVDLFLVMISLS
jgi:hypothetical protein